MLNIGMFLLGRKLISSLKHENMFRLKLFKCLLQTGDPFKFAVNGFADKKSGCNTRVLFRTQLVVSET